MYLGTFPSDFPTSERQTAQTDFTVQDRFGLFFDARLVSYFDEGFSSKCNRFTPRNHGHRTIGTNRAESWSNLGKYSRLSLPGLQTFYANIIALRHSNEGVFQLVSTHNCSDATMTGAMCLFYHNWPRDLAETLYNQHK